MIGECVSQIMCGDCVPTDMSLGVRTDNVLGMKSDQHSKYNFVID